MLNKRQIFIHQLIVSIASILLSNHLVLADQNQKQQPKLQSASELDYPPFAIVRPDGKADGFSVDLLKAVVDVADLEVNISVGPWSEIKQQLVEGRLDVLPLVAYSPERDEVLDFTAPYLQMHGTIFVRKGETSIRSEADLKDKEVLVMRDDASHEYAVSTKIPAKLILTTSFEEAMKLLSSGKHDAILSQYLMGLQLIKKLGIKNIISVSTTEYEENLKPRTIRVSNFEQKFSFAVPEGRKKLLAQLNEGLAIVVANGKYDQLYKKWFGPILPQPTVPLITVIKSVLFILIPILLVLAVVGVWYLKREVYRKTRSLRIEIVERKRVEKQIKVSLKEKETLLQEIHHRVKNNMQVISSLLKLQIRSADDKKIETALQDSQLRIQAMSFIHETLYGSDDLSSIEMQTYLLRLLNSIQQSYPNNIGKVTLAVDASNIALGVKQATPLGLIVNELVSNSYKYAFPDNEEGQISLQLKELDQRQIEMTYSDNGIGIPDDFDWYNTKSLGLDLVKLLSENQLNGSLVLKK